MNEKEFISIHKKRVVITFSFIMLLFLITVLRLSLLSSKKYSEVINTQNYYRLKAADIRGTIFDCNNNPITNNKKKIVAAVTQNPKAVTAISKILSGEALNSALERLRRGKPILIELPKKIEVEGIYCAEIYVTEYDTAIHTIGYVDNEKNGVTGIEKAYNNILKQSGSCEFVFEKNGKGEMLEGLTPKLEYDNGFLKNGVVTTLDLNLQKIAEEKAEGISCGAILVAESNSGKIRAIVSRPYFDINNLGISLADKSSPFLNRALNTFNIGSVFKPLVASVGIENGYEAFTNNCTGNTKIADLTFNCHKREGHGTLHLNEAIAYSCNTYFYNFALKIGKDEIYKTAKNLNFGQSIELCRGISAKAGNLTSISELSNKAELANLSIGQGKLLLSPISLLNLYNSIANGGLYTSPYLVEGILNNGKLTPEKEYLPTRVMKKETAEKLKNSLKAVLEIGTGSSAKPQYTTAAGKTATAQTGKYYSGSEICSGWFCGFFPFENPKYTVIVFSENTLKDTKSCAEIFSELADSITLNGY